MGWIRITGGRPLHGCLTVQGSKNAALPILAATLATKDRCVLHGCPDIQDVHTALALLRGLGCRAAFDGGTVTVDARERQGCAPDPALAGRMRASVLLLGALLAAEGRARIPLPGGCVLGARPLDLHLQALQALGASVEQEPAQLVCSAPKLRGGTVLLRYPSVGATENLMLAALAASGQVTIVGAAREPEIADLAAFLRACGAQVSGAGSSVVKIFPGRLHGCSYTVMPDRMAAATLLCAAASAGGCVRLENVRPQELEPVLETLRRAGCELAREQTALELRAGALHAAPPVVTAPYPGFPTDAQAPMMAALLRAEGVSVFDETVFEDRYRHVPALRRLGAQIEIAGAVARVRGVRRLHGAELTATDLRGGAAMLIAALAAEGESRLLETQHLLRGYERLPERLRRLGAQVTENTEAPR